MAYDSINDITFINPEVKFIFPGHESNTGAVIYSNDCNQVEVTITAKLFKGKGKIPARLSPEDFIAITRLYSGKGDMLQWNKNSNSDLLKFTNRKDERYCRALEYTGLADATAETFSFNEDGVHSVSYYIYCAGDDTQGYDVYVQFDKLNTAYFPKPPNTSGDGTLNRLKLHIEARKKINYSDAVNWIQPEDIHYDRSRMDEWESNWLYAHSVKLESRAPHKFLYFRCSIKGEGQPEYWLKRHGKADFLSYTDNSQIIGAWWGEAANIWLVGGDNSSAIPDFIGPLHEMDVLGFDNNHRSDIQYNDGRGYSWSIPAGVQMYRNLPTVQNNAIIFHRLVLGATSQDIRSESGPLDNFTPSMMLSVQDEYGNGGELRISFNSQATSIYINS